MKLPRHLIVSALLAAGIAAPLSAEDAPAAATAAPAAAEQPQFSDAQALEAFGWFMGQRMGAKDLEYSAEEKAAILKGVSAAFAGEKLPYEIQQIGPSIDRVLKAKQEVATTKATAKSKSESDAFFTELKKKDGVVALDSGLCYEIVKAGAGDFPKATDTVKVHYTGKLLDGSVFDSSVERGEPVSFPLNGVIPGWTEGLQKINKGGKIKLYIPAALGYGDRGAGNDIPPGATLVFDVELLDINPPAPAAETAPAAE